MTKDDINLSIPGISHTDLYHKLGVLEGKLDSIVGFEARVQSNFNSLGDRVTVLEKWRWFVLGMSAVAASLASYAIDLASFIGGAHG